MKTILSFVMVMMLGGTALAYTSAAKFTDKPDEWYRTPEAKTMASNVLSWQTIEGGWPKNTDTGGKAFTGDRESIHATFDNGATTFEMRYLARMFNATKNPLYRDAFVKGLDYILGAQYANGGWPQYSPPPKDSYHRYITFNDGAMGRLMFLLRDVAKDPIYNFVDSERRAACTKAWDKGVDCILKCQVKVDGKLTSWCAQHDEKTLEPRPARTFELASLSGCESVGLVHVLMNVEHPSPQVIAAVDAAIAWFKQVEIPGIRIEDRPTPNTPKGFERYVVKDASAPPMWARFYEIGTNRPIFADRDSVKKYKLSEIGTERRTGYKWYGYWPANLISKEYPAWKAKLAQSPAEKPAEAAR
jgi:PelA/Pel-15E family pectate lyase